MQGCTITSSADYQSPPACNTTVVGSACSSMQQCSGGWWLVAVVPRNCHRMAATGTSWHFGVLHYIQVNLRETRVEWLVGRAGFFWCLSMAAQPPHKQRTCSPVVCGGWSNGMCVRTVVGRISEGPCAGLPLQQHFCWTVSCGPECGVSPAGLSLRRQSGSCTVWRAPSPALMLGEVEVASRVVCG
jgi:hypothetical protein